MAASDNAEGSDGEIVLGVEDLLSRSVNQKLKELKAQSLTAVPGWAIPRIPSSARNTNPGAFDPKIISIGPFHRGQEELKPMEELKWRFLHDLIRRSPGNSPDKYVQAARSLERRARDCYLEPVQLNSDAFVEMMVLDGCFILEFLIKNILNEWRYQLFDVNSNLKLLGSDLLLLENQIPFSVLQSFFELTLVPQFQTRPYSFARQWSLLHKIGEGDDHRPITLKMIALDYFTGGRIIEILDQKPIHHLLHLFCISFLFVQPEPLDHKLGGSYTIQLLQKHVRRVVFGGFFWFLSLFLYLPCRNTRGHHDSYIWSQLPNASQLRKAGVNFFPKAARESMDIKFEYESGALHMPRLRVNTITFTIMRNLIMFENLNRQGTKYANSYMLVMVSLISTAADAALLEDCGVLLNRLGSHEEVATFFNRFEAEGNLDLESSFHFQPVLDLVEYSMDKSRRWKASLMHDYFSNPWTMISVVAAIILLLMAFLQTYFSIYGYFHARSS